MWLGTLSVYEYETAGLAQTQESEFLNNSNPGGTQQQERAVRHLPASREQRQAPVEDCGTTAEVVQVELGDAVVLFVLSLEVDAVARRHRAVEREVARVDDADLHQAANAAVLLQTNLGADRDNRVGRVTLGEALPDAEHVPRCGRR